MSGGLIIFVILIGLIPAMIAQRKGHSFVGFWIFGAALFIVALPVALVMKPNLTGKRKCPHCTEYVAAEATVCKHCQRDLPSLPPAGWYPVEGQLYERYWDGNQWTSKARRDDPV